MSRNDDFVNIDHFFKGIANAEEREPAEAWDKMEGLLDEKMPVNVHDSSRKYGFFFLMASVLIVAAGLFFWKKGEITAYFNSETNTTNSIAKNNIDPNKNAGHSNNESEPENTNNKGNLGVTAIGSEIQSKVNKKETKTIIVASNNKSETIYKKSNSINEANSEIPDLNIKKLEQQKPVQNIRIKPSAKPAIAKNIDRLPSLIISDSLLVSQPIIEHKVVEVIKGDSKQIEKTMALQNEHIAEDWSSEFSFKGKTVVANENGQLFEKEKEQFERIDLTKKQIVSKPNTSRVKTIVDTISIAKIQKIKYTPLSKIEAYEVNQILIAAAPPIMKSVNAIELANATSTGSNFLVPLSNYKVKSQKVNTVDFIKNTADGINNYFDRMDKFYAGFLLGGNASPGVQSAYGIQAGFVGNYNFAERWTLSAEFKFINKYFPSFSYQDEAENFNVSKEEQNNGWLFTGTRTTFSNTYELKNINIINFPVYLSYNITDRLALMTGVNLNYNMPLQFTRSVTVSSFTVNELRSSAESPFQNSNFKLDESRDFSKRFGVGYLVGMNYELSRRFSLDCRMTQSLWNNGAKNISDINGIYNNPSFELSLGIYFGRRDKVVYIMDRK